MTEDIKHELSQKLNKDNIESRNQSGMNLSYIASHHAIREANRIFGFDGWTFVVLRVDMVQEVEVNGKWRVGYTAQVEVQAIGVTRQDCGFGQGIDGDLGRAHESAIKEAVSDAQKRALRMFGDQFGLALYDKSQAHVEHDTRPKPITSDQAKKQWTTYWQQLGGTPEGWKQLKMPDVETHKMVAEAVEAGCKTLEAISAYIHDGVIRDEKTAAIAAELAQ